MCTALEFFAFPRGLQVLHRSIAGIRRHSRKRQLRNVLFEEDRIRF